jgi:pyruvate/2-oxoglutarate dehydrogenase complex dihydrolipoamide dehydrogenase (E3) component
LRGCLLESRHSRHGELRPHRARLPSGGTTRGDSSGEVCKLAARGEKLEVIGGTAVNTGTIPSKSNRKEVLHLSGFGYRGICGVNYGVKEQITMADRAFRARHVIKTEIDVIGACS